MTLTEAAKQGVRRLRLPDWSEETYLVIDIAPEGTLGPVAHLHSYGEETAFRHDGPYGIPCLKEWVAYEE